MQINLCNDSKWSRYKRAGMIMKTHKLLWNILFSNKKSGLYGAFCDLESLVLMQNIRSTCGRKLCLVLSCNPTPY